VDTDGDDAANQRLDATTPQAAAAAAACLPNGLPMWPQECMTHVGWVSCLGQLKKRPESCDAVPIERQDSRTGLRILDLCGQASAFPRSRPIARPTSKLEPDLEGCLPAPATHLWWGVEPAWFRIEEGPGMTEPATTTTSNFNTWESLLGSIALQFWLVPWRTEN